MTDKYITTFNARELSIEWGDDPLRWKWIKEEIPGSTDDDKQFVEVAELLNVNWLEVRKVVKLDMLVFSGTEDYNVAFEVKMLGNASGWESPVTLSWKKLDSQQTEHTTPQDMRSLPTNEWVKIHVGSFKKSDITQADILVRMFQHAGVVKRGVVIKSLIISPVVK